MRLRERVGRPPVEIGDPIGAEEPGQQGYCVAVGHRVHGPAEVEGVSDLDGLPRRTEEHGRGPELADGVNHHDELVAVRRHHGHAVACGDPLGSQMTGEGVAETVQIAEGPSLVAAANRLAVPVPERGSLQGFVDQGVFHRKPSSPI